MAAGLPVSSWSGLGMATSLPDLALIVLGMLLGGACLAVGMFLLRRRRAQKRLKIEGSPPASAEAGVDASPLLLPKNVRLEKGAHGLRISYKRFRWQALLGLPILAVLAWFLLWAYQAGDLLLTALYSTLSLYVVYTLLVAMVARVTIQVTQGELCIRRRPLPWPGRRRLECGEIKRLYTHRAVIPGRRGDTTVYMLRAVLQDGREVRLVSELPYEATRYMQTQIEAWLGLKV